MFFSSQEDFLYYTIIGLHCCIFNSIILIVFHLIDTKFCCLYTWIECLTKRKLWCFRGDTHSYETNYFKGQLIFILFWSQTFVHYNSCIAVKYVQVFLFSATLFCLFEELFICFFANAFPSFYGIVQFESICCWWKYWHVCSSSN